MAGDLTPENPDGRPSGPPIPVFGGTETEHAEAPSGRTRELVVERLHTFLEEQRHGSRSTQLYHHQIAMLERVQTFLSGDESRGWIKAPTGTGKTATFASVSAATGMKSLVLVPTEKLVEQTASAYQKFFPELSVSRFYGQKKEELSSEVVVCTYQSLAKLIAKAESEGEVFPLVICDEAHRALTGNRQRLIANIPGSEKVLAFTATPEFSEAKRVSHHFGDFLFKMELRDAIQIGALSPVRCIRVNTGINISDLKINKASGDFDTDELAKRLNVYSRNQAVLNILKKPLCRDKSATAFCITIEHANTLVQQAERSGIRAASIHSKMPRNEQEDILQRYEKGQIELLCSVDMLTEGWDSPRTELAFMLRPTKSLVVAEQRLGRILRRYSSHDDAISFFALPENSSKSAVAICSSSADAAAFKERAERSGISSATISEETPPAERQRIIEDQKSGRLQLVCTNLAELAEAGEAVLVLDSTKLEQMSERIPLQKLENVAGKKFAIVFDFNDGDASQGILAPDILGGVAVMPSSTEAEFQQEIRRLGGGGSLDLELDGIEVVTDLEEVMKVAPGSLSDLVREQFHSKEEVLAILAEAGFDSASSVGNLSYSKFLGTKISVDATNSHKEFRGTITTLLFRFYREVEGIEPALAPKELHKDALQDLFGHAALRSYIHGRVQSTAAASEIRRFLDASVRMSVNELLNLQFEVGIPTPVTVRGADYLQALERSRLFKHGVSGPFTPNESGILNLAKTFIPESAFPCFLQEFRACQKVRDLARKGELAPLLQSVPTIGSMGPLEFKSQWFGAFSGQTVLLALDITHIDQFSALVRESDLSEEDDDPRAADVDTAEIGNLDWEITPAGVRQLDAADAWGVEHPLRRAFAELPEEILQDAFAAMNYQVQERSRISGAHLLGTYEIDTPQKLIDFIEGARTSRLSNTFKSTVLGDMRWNAILRSVTTNARRYEKDGDGTIKFHDPQSTPHALLSVLSDAAKGFREFTYSGEELGRTTAIFRLQIALDLVALRVLPAQGARISDLGSIFNALSSCGLIDPDSENPNIRALAQTLGRLEDKAGLRMQGKVSDPDGAVVRTIGTNLSKGYFRISAKSPSGEDLFHLPIEASPSSTGLGIAHVNADHLTTGEMTEELLRESATQCIQLMNVLQLGLVKLAGDSESAERFAAQLEAEGILVIRTFGREVGKLGPSLASLAAIPPHSLLNQPELFGSAETRGLLAKARDAREQLSPTQRRLETALQGEISPNLRDFANFMVDWIDQEMNKVRPTLSGTSRLEVAMNRLSIAEAEGRIEEVLVETVSELLENNRGSTSTPLDAYRDFLNVWRVHEDRLAQASIALPPELALRKLELIRGLMESSRRLPLVAPAGWYREKDDLTTALAQVGVQEKVETSADSLQLPRPDDARIAELKRRNNPPWFSEKNGTLQLFVGGKAYDQNKSLLHWNPNCQRLTAPEREVSYQDLIEEHGSDYAAAAKYECCKGCNSPAIKFMSRQNLSAYKTKPEERVWWG